MSIGTGKTELENGIKLFRKSVIAKEKPSDEILNICYQVGRDLANAWQNSHIGDFIYG